MNSEKVGHQYQDIYFRVRKVNDQIENEDEEEDDLSEQLNDIIQEAMNGDDPEQNADEPPADLIVD